VVLGNIKTHLKTVAIEAAKDIEKAVKSQFTEADYRYSDPLSVFVLRWAVASAHALRS